MKLFNLMGNELAFLKQELALNAPMAMEFAVAGVNCFHCETVCASGCGANCSGPNTSHR
jgi:hypothetical protein